MKRILICMMAVVLSMAVFAACSPKASSESGVPNPVVEKKSLEDITKTIGFEMPPLPEKYQPRAIEGQPQPYSVIDDKLAQVEYGIDGTDTVITFRMMKGSDDISGIYGVDYEKETMNGIPVNVGTYNGTQVAWFTHGDYTYSLTATDMNGTDFMSLVNDVTALVASPPATE